MRNLKVLMKRNLKDIPDYKLPLEFKFQHFKEGDEKEWGRIETAVGEFDSQKQALKRFSEEFAPYIEEFQERSLFLVNKEDEKIGTITAWYGDYKGNQMGRIHWVGLLPEYQGKGLAKPMLSAAMRILAQHHHYVYLTTQTKSYPAINLYLKFGFQPVITTESDIEAWRLLEKKLNKNILFD